MDIDERKIGLSLKRAQWGGADEGLDGDSTGDGPGEQDLPTRGGMDDHGAMGTDKIEF